MRYHNITKDDMLNGDGLRVVLWLSGCSHNCPGCQNPITWNPDGGLLFDNDAKQEIFDLLDKDYISGITFSGGDPLHPVNAYEVRELAAEIRQKYPDKTIWLYTGDVWEDLVLGGSRCTLDTPAILENIDVMVDGLFIEDLKDITLRFRGSSNQRIIDVPASRAAGAVQLVQVDPALVRGTGGPR